MSDYLGERDRERETEREREKECVCVCVCFGKFTFKITIKYNMQLTVFKESQKCLT